jgi:hypothetical protein
VAHPLIVSDRGGGSTPSGEPLRVEYRRIQAMTCKGNRRVRVDSDGRVFADVATRDCPPGVDWNGPWPTTPVRTLDAAERARLGDTISASGFFELPPRVERAATDGYRDEIDVALGARRHSVTVEHAEPPAAFARVRAAVLAAARS